MIIAGVSGALSGIFLKLALSSDTYVIVTSTEYLGYLFQFDRKNQLFISWILRAVCFAITLYSNAMMLTHFLKSLELRGSLPVTVVCFAVNFVVTGILGNFILNEELNSVWCIGALFIIVGLFFVLFSQGNGPMSCTKKLKTGNASDISLNPN